MIRIKDVEFKNCRPFINEHFGPEEKSINLSAADIYIYLHISHVMNMHFIQRFVCFYPRALV